MKGNVPAFSILFLTSVVLAVVLTSCGAMGPTATPMATLVPLPTVSLQPLIGTTIFSPAPMPTFELSNKHVSFCLEEARKYELDLRRKWLIVCQSRQLMLAGDGDDVIKEFPVSTGRPQKSATPFWKGTVGGYYGTFVGVDGTYADDAWFLFRKNGGTYLIHSLPYHMIDGKKTYVGGNDLGRRPVSHGCIRLSPEDASWLKKWNPEGAAILITPCNCGG